MALAFCIPFFGCAPAPSSAPWADYAGRPEAWYRTDEGKRIISNVLSWQTTYGSWPKNVDTATTPRPERPKNPEWLHGTFDNGATLEELRFLSRAFRATHEPGCGKAFHQGLQAILDAQYPTGGWPLFHPPSDRYHRHITFNDGTMVGLMRFVGEVATSSDYAFVEQAQREAAQTAFARGVQCILKCQIVTNGKRTVWCQQHDEVDYQPRPARAYELVALCGDESAGILELLMSLDNPSPEVVRAIEAGVAWFESTKLTGLRVNSTKRDTVVTQDSSAPPVWARFYEIETNHPFFCGRDGLKRFNLSEIERERRTGYRWYGDWGEKVARQYAEWQTKWPAARLHKE